MRGTTAIDGLARLETTALWRPEAGAQRREVYVSIGEAELVVQDRGGTALSHWSLPALIRRNPGESPAIYAPSEGADEELEIDESVMIAALDRVMDAVEMGRRRPGALRRLTVGLIAGFSVGLLILWLPGALRNHAENVMPAAQRADIGDRMMTELTTLTGPPCGSPTGDEALRILRDRLIPTSPVRFAVLRDLPQPALALPGGLVVISDVVLVTQDDPTVAAGHIMAAFLTARERAPLGTFLDGVGAQALVRILASGEVRDETITDHVEQLLLRPPVVLGPDALQPGFAAARLPWAPYAAATGQPSGEAPPTDMPPVLDDITWQALREICDS
ncbi:hypothetical protein [Jannaschia pohangensis]|uniref:Uncharacterized protein n=1 Tax=Jannaschia pohangensis TaxID=390807 RepID=A0A1I3GA31_9RHOB|nr:hypothetical protein [Jannaschia pohangensis]SFI20358.1 hypothetical protein SAMN04488095_0109 [Jannaschia pohangensis]